MNCPGCGQPITELIRTSVQRVTLFGGEFLTPVPSNISQVLEHSCGFKGFGVTRGWYMDEEHAKLIVTERSASPAVA